jgi:4-amino-4-deoxy-L-arabinose transferase-like glycosyltransferase
MLINIYSSDGAWFNKINNIISFSIVVALASMIRHNGIFFTIPLLILALVFYFKQTRRVLIAVLSVLLIIFFVKVPLYSALNVTYPHNTYIESVGVPMTIMGDVFVKKPDALLPEIKAFLNNVATDEQWRSFYKTGNYNSIKWHSSSEVIKTVPVSQFIKMTLHSIKSG